MSGLAQAVFARTPPSLRWRALALQHRRHEPELGRLHELIPEGGVAVDVGAWWGPWTYWLSRRASKVVAVEPVPHLAEFLRGVVPPTVTVVEAVASDSRGPITLYLPDRGVGSEGRATVHESGRGADMVPVHVEALRIDDLGLDRVDLLKIDVEGHELAVLEGAAETIARTKPVIVVEIEQRFHAEPFDEIVARIEAGGYDGSFLDDGSWRSIHEFDVATMQTAFEQQAVSSGYASVRRGGYRNNFVFRPRVRDR